MFPVVELEILHESMLCFLWILAKIFFMLHSLLKTITIVIDILSEVRKLLAGIENDYKK